MNAALNVLVAIVGGVYVLFLPGLALSFAFFRRHSIGGIERLALSFALSVAVVPLVAFYLNLAGVKLTRWSVVAEVFGVITIGSAVAWWRHRSAQKAPLSTGEMPAVESAPELTEPVGERRAKPTARPGAPAPTPARPVPKRPRRRINF